MIRKGVQHSDDNNNDDDLCVAGKVNKEVKDEEENTETTYSNIYQP